MRGALPGIISADTSTDWALRLVCTAFVHQIPFSSPPTLSDSSQCPHCHLHSAWAEQLCSCLPPSFVSPAAALSSTAWPLARGLPPEVKRLFQCLNSTETGPRHTFPTTQCFHTGIDCPSRRHVSDAPAATSMATDHLPVCALLRFS